MSVVIITVSTALALSIGLLILNVWQMEVAFDNRERIARAIYHYQVHCKIYHKPIIVDYCDMETPDATYNRFWDWGYTRILPKDKFELIKPYIGR